MIFSCGDGGKIKKLEDRIAELETANKAKTTPVRICSITENIWINETNQIRNFYRDYLPASLESEFYFALRFLKNGNIEVYKCGKSFINKTSDIIVDSLGVWWLNQYSGLEDTCCYLITHYQPNLLPRWKKIDDNTVIIIYPEPQWPQNIGGKPNLTPTQFSRYDTINLIDCNRLEVSDGIRFLMNCIPGTILENSDYNRSPKLN